MLDKPASTFGFLTSDNYYLSRPNPGLVHGSAVDGTDLAEAVAGYVRDSLAENTRRAYQSDLRHFELWGGSLRFPRNCCRLPCGSRRPPQRDDVDPASCHIVESAPGARVRESYLLRTRPDNAARHKTEATAHSAAG
jgi:hypothetical protein